MPWNQSSSVSIGVGVRLALSLVVIGALLLPAQTVASEDNYRLRLAGGVAESHASAQATEHWVKRVEELSDGRITINTIWAGSLLSALEVMPGVRDGRVQIGQSSTSWHPSELPLTYLATVPFLTYDGEAAARAMNHLYATEEQFRAEYERQGLHLISFQPLDVVLLGGRDTWNGIDDLRGLQIRAAGDWEAALAAVGAQPVGVPYVEIYEAIQRRVIDGYGLNFEGIYDVQLHEVAPIMHDPGLGQITSMNLLINLDTWNSLPEDVQNIMEQAAQDMMDEVSAIYTEVNERQCEAMTSAGARFISWPEEETERWAAMLGDSLLESWMQATRDAEYAATFLERYQDEMAAQEGNSSWQSAFSLCQHASR